MLSWRGKRSMAVKASKSSRVRLARSRMLEVGEKRSSVRATVAERSWAKRERRREVALYRTLMLEYDHLDYVVTSLSNHGISPIMPSVC